MKKVLFITACLIGTYHHGISQSNVLRADASASIGILFPGGPDKPDRMKSGGLLQYAKTGYGLHADCHSGIGSGWKLGLSFSLLNSPINGDAMSAYARSTIDTIGFFVTTKNINEGSYNSRLASVQVANDINFGQWILTPKFNLGLVAQNVFFSASYDLKHDGDNYRKEVQVRSYDLPTYGISISPGFRLGYSFKFFEDVCCVFISGEIFKYRCPVRLDYTTTDIHDSVDTNIRWFSGNVFYRIVGFGLTYYVN